MRPDTPMDALGPGIHRGISFAGYLAIPGANHSLLRTFARSAAHAREEMLHPAASTAAQEFGQALHAAVLEPAEFERQYAEAEKVDRRTKAGKARWSELEAQNGSRTLLPAAQWESVLAMKAALLGHATARELLTGPGANEVCAIWDDATTGVRCKGRIDRLATLAGWTFVVDLKTAECADPQEWGRHSAKWGYHEQAAFYLDGLAALAPASRRFAHVVIEKDRPFAVAVCELDDEAISEGRRRYRRHLARWAECERSGEWPGYAEGIHPVRLPTWALSMEGAEP